MKILLIIFGMVLSIFVRAASNSEQSASSNESAEIAFKKLIRAAEAGNAKAQAYLGFAYCEGKGGASKDYQKAFQWYSKAAEQGNVDAEGHLAQMYAEGVGIKKDYQQAIRWYRKAANQGNNDAQYNLGALYCSNVVQKRVEVCYALISLSVENDISGISKAALNMHAKEMTAIEIDAGKKLALEMVKPNNLLIALDEYVNTHPATKK